MFTAKHEFRSYRQRPSKSHAFHSFARFVTHIYICTEIKVTRFDGDIEILSLQHFSLTYSLFALDK